VKAYQLHRFLKNLVNCGSLLSTYKSLELLFRKFLFSLSPLFLVEYLHIKQRGRIFNPWNSQTFDQKLLWLMLYWRHPLKTRCADKYAVRSYVEEQGLGHILPDLLGVYANSSEIDFHRLPERFVLKCTRSWGFNIFCKDKRVFDIVGLISAALLARFTMPQSFLE
jgi:hypothetical protein